MKLKKESPFYDIQAIAFDLDGTLVNSVPGLSKAINLALQDLTLAPVSQDLVIGWVGDGITKLVERALSHLGVAEQLQPKVIELFNHHYARCLDTGTILFPGVKETLSTLHKNNYPIALVTNKPRHFLPDLLSSLTIAPYFSLCLGDGDCIKLKPHPAPLYQVMASFGLFNNQLLFVGDSRNDILAAKNANCPTIALSYGYNYGESIAQSQPDVICDSFSEILSYIPIPRNMVLK